MESKNLDVLESKCVLSVSALEQINESIKGKCAAIQTKEGWDDAAREQEE
jgi:hypothetical protein